MTADDYQNLEHGIYRIFWKDGGHSLASVGSDSHGKRWFAPTNWVTVPWSDWSAVERVELLIFKAPALNETQIEQIKKIVFPHRYRVET